MSPIQKKTNPPSEARATPHQPWAIPEKRSLTRHSRRECPPRDVWMLLKKQGSLSPLSSFSGAEIQPGPVCEQALPGPGEDREEQQAGGPDPGQAARLERCHGARGRLLRCPRRVQLWLVSEGHSVSAVALSCLCDVLFSSLFFFPVQRDVICYDCH